MPPPLPRCIAADGLSAAATIIIEVEEVTPGAGVSANGGAVAPAMAGRNFPGCRGGVWTIWPSWALY